MQFLQQAYLPLLARMGARIDVAMPRHGFYPAGGGEVVATVTPCAGLGQLALMSAAPVSPDMPTRSWPASPSVGVRELDCIAATMEWRGAQLRLHQLASDEGPGNAVLITLEQEHVTEVFACFGARAVKAGAVAQEAIDQVRAYMDSTQPSVSTWRISWCSRWHSRVAAVFPPPLFLPMRKQMST